MARVHFLAFSARNVWPFFDLRHLVTLLNQKGNIWQMKLFKNIKVTMEANKISHFFVNRQWRLWEMSSIFGYQLINFN